MGKDASIINNMIIEGNQKGTIKMMNSEIINNNSEIANDEINNVNEEETIKMTNENNNNNVITNMPVLKIEWVADPTERKATEAKFAALGLSFEWIRPKVKTNLVIDEATHLATCPVCGKQFNVDDYDVDMQKRAHASGLCQECIKMYDVLNSKMGKSAAKTSTGERLIVNGGQNAGERIRAAFKLAVDAGRIDEELLENMCDREWTKQTLKLKYALLKDVTNCTPEEIKIKLSEDNLNGKKNPRYISRVRYTINARVFIITNDMYTKDIEHVNKQFHALGLLSENQNI